jgi:sec-independent protein translocase protein TatC
LPARAPGARLERFRATAIADMSNQREDDLFRESTMTFGQHLEELRACLFKAIGGLLVGFIIGLGVGNYVVEFIQSPLLKALGNYYQKESQQRVNAEVARLEESGRTSPWTAEQVKTLVEKENLLADVFYVDPAQMLQELKDAYPRQFKGIELPPAETSEEGDGKATSSKSKLIPLFLWHPSGEDPRLRTKGLAMVEPFSIYIKASLLVGVILASPWIFYQIWHFVAAGLYPHERQYVHRYLPFSLGLFLAGAALAFFVVFEPVLDFLLSFNRSQGIIPEPRINEWLGFVLILPVGFGVGFQLPLVMLFLERIGVFTVQGYLKQWRIAVLVIFVLAAILTPPDVYSMLLLAGSLTVLYFGGILLCKLLPRRSSPFQS